MRMGTQSRQYSFAASAIPLTLLAVFLVLSLSQPANALPAFARKYGLRCSACHESWPMLNYFGQKFKDNGYQLGRPDTRLARVGKTRISPNCSHCSR